MEIVSSFLSAFFQLKCHTQLSTVNLSLSPLQWERGEMSLSHCVLFGDIQPRERGERENAK